MKTTLAAIASLLLLAVPTVAAFADAPGPIDPAKYSAPVRVACVGDSITIGAKSKNPYPKQLQEMLGDKWLVKNCGVSGRTLLKKGDHPYWREKAFQAAKDFNPDAVIIMLGTNDTKPQNWAHHDEFYADYKELVETFKNLASKPKVFICIPCPVFPPGNYGINEANLDVEIPLIKQLAAEENVGLIDMHTPLLGKPQLESDHVHPGADGDTVLAQTAADALTGEDEALMKAPLAAIASLLWLVLPSVAVFADAPAPIDPAKYSGPVRVACIGDSITSGFGSNNPYPAQLQGILGDKWLVKNFGVSGRTLLKKGNLPYWKEKAFQEARDWKPDAVVILLGTNDTKPKNWIYHDGFYADYKELVETFKNLASKPRVFVCIPCPVFPPGCYTINEENLDVEIPLIKKLAAEENIGLIDLHTPLLDKPQLESDHVHPTAEGDTLVAQIVADALTENADRSPQKLRFQIPPIIP